MRFIFLPIIVLFFLFLGLTKVQDRQAVPAIPNSQALIDAAPDCSTVRLTERSIDKLVIRNRRRLRILPAENLAEVYIKELVIDSSRECEIERMTFAANGDSTKPAGLQIHYTDGTHPAINNVVRWCLFKKYQAGIVVGELANVGPPANQLQCESNRIEDCTFENCDMGLLINSANAQLTTTKDCHWSGNKIGTYCKLGQYLDDTGKYLLSTTVDVRIDDAVLPCLFYKTYTEQSNRFLETGGPTLSGWPITMTGCSIVGSGSPYTWPGETVPRYGDRHFAIIHKQSQLLLHGCTFGITFTPLYIGVGGGDTALVDLNGSQFWTKDQEEPVLDFNATTTVSGQYTIRDPNQLKVPKTRTRVSLVNPTVNVINTVDSDKDYLTIRHRGRSIWAKSDFSSGLLSETRLDGTRILVYDATVGIARQMSMLKFFP